MPYPSGVRKLLFILSLSLLVSCGSRQSPAEHAGHTNTAVDHSKMNHDHHAMQTSPDAAKAPYELQFIDTMIVHHQGAIDMAELAETRALHEEIKELARNIINEQEREIASLSKWREKWFAESSPAVNMEFPGMNEGMKGMDTKKLESLKGNDFDLEFIRQMIPHHEGAVLMAKDAQKIDSYAELKNLAADIIDSQTAEIEQMKKWQSDWTRP